MSNRNKAAQLVDLTRDDAQAVAIETRGDIINLNRRNIIDRDQQPVMIVLDDSIVGRAANDMQQPQDQQPELIDVSDDDSDLICVNNSSSRNNSFNHNHNNSNCSSSSHHSSRSHSTVSFATSNTSDSKRKLPCRTPTHFHLPESKRRPPPPPPESPDNSLKCPICIESYKIIKTRGIKVVVTRCGHLFCDSCLKKAFIENGRKCPKCRRSVPKSATSVIEIFDVC